MNTLHTLIDEARALGQGALGAEEAEVARQLTICNGCRYCEGFCAVFPAMTRRLSFASADIHYMANLCHNCGACLHACQYAPPHEFAINVPRAMAQVRGKTYADYAWPAPLGRLYRQQGLTLSLALAAGLRWGGLEGAGWAVSLAMLGYFGWYFIALARWPVVTP